MEMSQHCWSHNKILRESLKSPPLRRFLILFLGLLDLLVVSQNSLVSIVGFAFAQIVSELAVHVLHVTFVIAA